MTKQSAAFLAFLLSAAAACLAQEVPASDESPQAVRILVSLSAPSKSATRLADSLDTALAKSPAILAVVRSPKERSLGLEIFAKNAGCRLVLAVKAVSGSRGSFLLTYTLADSATGESLSSGTMERPLSSDSDLASWFWSDLAVAVEAAVAKLPVSEPAPAMSAVTISGAPGTKIAGMGEELVLPESGVLSITMSLPAYYEWRAVQDGAWDEAGTALLTESEAQILIPSRPFPRWSLDVGAWGLCFPELRATWQLDSMLFLRASLSQFLAGISLSSSSNTSFFASYGLLQPGIGALLHFSDLRSTSRLYASLDLFLRVAVPSPQAAFVDPVAPLGLLPAAGFEWGRAEKSRIFMELGLILYPWASPGLMLASMGGDSKENRLVLGGTGFFEGHPGWFVEFPVLRTGVRFYL